MRQRLPRLANQTSFKLISLILIPFALTPGREKYKKYYNCIFSIECNLRKHGAVTNQTPFLFFQRQEKKLRVWFGWPAV